MNPITVFLSIACLAIGVALGAIGHLYAGIAVVVVAVVISAALKMAAMMRGLCTVTTSAYSAAEAAAAAVAWRCALRDCILLSAKAIRELPRPPAPPYMAF